MQMSTSSIVAIVLAGWLVAILLSGVLLWRMISARRVRDLRMLEMGPVTDEAGATEFPVHGATTRAGFLQGGYSKNSINPRFWVARDGVRIRILKMWHLPFADLTQIDVRKIMNGMALIFRIEAGNRAFVVRFGDARLARSALALVAPSVPLTEEAAILRDGDARAATPGLPRYRGPLR
jgi:hypothetical protein